MDDLLELKVSMVNDIHGIRIALEGILVRQTEVATELKRIADALVGGVDNPTGITIKPGIPTTRP